MNQGEDSPIIRGGIACGRGSTAGFVSTAPIDSFAPGGRGLKACLTLVIVSLSWGSVSSPASASEASEALVASEIVRTYYVFGGVSPTAEQLATGVPVAIELLRSGHSRHDLEVALVRIVRETDLWKEQPFEVAVHSWMATHGSTPDREPAPVEIEESVPDVEPQGPDEAVRVAEEPPPVPSPVESQEKPAAEVPHEDVAPNPPASVDTKPSAPAESDEPEEVVVAPTAPVHAPPANKAWRRFETGLIVTGSVLLGGGMVGGAISSGIYAQAAHFNPGYTVAIGAIPFAGPGAVHNYWTTYAGDQASVLENYVGIAVALTAVEIAGAGLLVVGIASHCSNKRSHAIGGRRSRTVLVVPSVSSKSAYLAVAGRF